ncbi:MAG: methionine ABC transporter permease [Fretibacterium sp.]|uniref:methionine ABC transporter permease n=1 Tax=Fretibacterium sp. OH1220_COT-178 TaxID=2491047 RepID=UPI000F5E8AAF|nr:methionine ABC transporter permease [Fretibacterium sp. OH1220_COT-178]MDO4785399.1 methionine ABC transporter permease [Fretibacterium sp.]RRD63391.1 ABC transporter permease [Fretibacterium sp. OH1220_COT-178]
MSAAIWKLLWQASCETLYMIGVSGLLACLGGIPLGVVLAATSPMGLMPRPWLNRTLGFVVNATRSTPFIILMVAIIPLTRLIVGRSIGTTAAVVPLALAALPFMGRLVESALNEVDGGVVEAAQAMGASPMRIVMKVLFPEAVPGLLRGVTLMLVNLVGYSAMAGAVGGGGLGDLAIRFGHQRFRPDVMLATIVVMIVMVQFIQSVGDWAVRGILRRRGLVE